MAEHHFNFYDSAKKSNLGEIKVGKLVNLWREKKKNLKIVKKLDCVRLVLCALIGCAM